MIAITVLLSLLVAGSALAAASPRIIGGEEAVQGEYPSQVSLQNLEKHVCSASVISENWVVTTGHCVHGLPVADHSVLAGSVSLSSGGSRHQVVEAIVHENYDQEDAWRNDIAVLRVEPPLEIDNVNVKPINLPVQGENPAVDSVATVVGWGAQILSGEISDTLRKVNLQVRDQEQCASSYQTLNLNIQDGQICADDPQERKGSCNGDTGSPLIVDDVLQGLFSFTLLCAVPGYPAVYTRVAHYRDWIAENTGV